MQVGGHVQPPVAPLLLNKGTVLKFWTVLKVSRQLWFQFLKRGLVLKKKPELKQNVNSVENVNLVASSMNIDKSIINLI